MANIANDYPHNVRNIMDLTDQLRAFVATAQTGSFTAAAERLGISNRLSSKYVAELEARLGTRLLQRTTRRVGLTPAGERLLAQAPDWLDGLDAMLGDVTEQTRGYSGLLRISAPVTFGESHIAEMLARFAQAHPALEIDLRLSDSHVDLASEGIDLAFRIGRLQDSALKSRRLARFGMKIAASPAYLARAGVPSRPEELADHACIHDTNHGQRALWTIGTAEAPHEIRIRPALRVNSARAARELALAGHGITFGPDFVLGPDIAAGRLEALMPGLALPERTLHAVYLDGPALPRKLRALIEFAAQDLRGLSA